MVHLSSPYEAPPTPPSPGEPSNDLPMRLLAIDCEMVGVGEFDQSELARVSIVNELGTCIYDSFAKPTEEVTYFRTAKSGVRAEDLENAPTLDSVRAQVAALVKGKVLVGHSIRNDLRVLKLENHPEVRDTALFYKEKLERFASPSLKFLAKECLNLEIQTAEHSSIEDAKVTLELYLLHRQEWEEGLLTKTKASLLDNTLFNNVSPKTPISQLSVHPTVDDIEADSSNVFLRKNLVAGSYNSTDHYADVQFRLMREDLLRPIRERVSYIRKNPHLCRGGVKWIYRNVQLQITSKGKELLPGDDRDPVLGFEVKGSGLLKIPIDINNLREIDWSEAKLFMGGSLLIFSPDSFKSVKLAVVTRGGPGRDLKIKDDDYHLFLHVYFIIDGVSLALNKWHKVALVESPAYFEAYRHTLQQFHALDFDGYALKKYIVDAETRPHLPGYLKKLASNGKLCLDFSVFLKNEKKIKVPIPNLEILENFTELELPSHFELGWDESQHRAFFTSIFQELSIVQGPPGTGKTFLGLQLMKFYLSQPALTGKSPLLVVAYTNHALDQSLELVWKFLLKREGPDSAYQSVLRIGGGCKSELIIPLTEKAKEEKYELQKLRVQQIERTLERLHILERFLQRLKETGILDELNDASSPGFLNFFSLPEELMDLVCEQDKVMGRRVWLAWNRIWEEKSFLSDPAKLWGYGGVEGLEIGRPGDIFQLKSKNGYAIDCTLPEGVNFDADEVAMLLRQSEINFDKGIGVLEQTGLVAYLYCYLLKKLRKLAAEFPQKLKSLEAEQSLILSKMKKPLKGVRVIGMTTTGAVKMKKIVNKLRPKITFVEEAAHVLESHVVAGLTEDMEQLILIGDHQQLRPLTADHDLTNVYSLDVSLMERLVRNGIQQGRKNWVQLNIQHRMRPEIADLIRPVIYKVLHDHPDVSTWPSVKGVEKNLFFIDHQEINSREKYSTSYVNQFEAKFVFDLVKHLVLNEGYLPSSVTVIASYAAQKFLIQKDFTLHTERYGSELDKVLVSTIDGYQGEQNDIVIFSLVRSNKEKSIGFLKTDNRVCVALSRARHGFYMVGNMNCLVNGSDTWRHVKQVLTRKNCIGPRLPLSNGKSLPSKTANANNHANSVGVQPKLTSSPSKMSPSCSHGNGKQSCTKSIKKHLPCRHVVNVPCNLAAQQIMCKKIVWKKLPCGHRRGRECHIPLEKIECDQRMSSIKFPCGHERIYSSAARCSKVARTCEKCIPPKPKPSKPRSKPKLKLPCGHFVPPSPLGAAKPKCDRMAIKTLSCGHEIKYPCGTSPETLRCDARITKVTFSKCNHEINFAPPGARCSKVQECSVHVPFKIFDCGHNIHVPCHKLATTPAVNRCNKKIKSKILPCGHEYIFPPQGAICGKVFKKAYPCSFCKSLNLTLGMLNGLALN